MVSAGAGTTTQALDRAAVEGFLAQLGIEKKDEADFGWIAEVGLQSPLPPRWTSHDDYDSGCVYYVDHDRQVSSWENPLVPYIRRVVEIGRLYRQDPVEGFFEEQRGLLWHQHKHELDQWHGPVLDDEGRQYFVNASQNVSSWQDPRVEAQYIFELESGLLTGLENVLSHLEPHARQHAPEVWTLDPITEVTSPARKRFSMSAKLVSDPDLVDRDSMEALKVIAGRKAQRDHTSALEVMGEQLEHMQSLRKDQEEVQRLAFAKKLEERKRRRAAKAAGLCDLRPPAPSAAKLFAPPPLDDARSPSRPPSMPPSPGGQGAGRIESALSIS